MTTAIVIALNLIAVTLIAYRVSLGCRHCRVRTRHDDQRSNRPVRGHLWLWDQQFNRKDRNR